jgi:hypothetical protein
VVMDEKKEAERVLYENGADFSTVCKLL